MKIGYMRISRDKQTTLLQEDALQQEECERTYTDSMSGARNDRPEFQRMLDVARKGDIIIVWRLDRLGRSLKQLIETVTVLAEREIELRSLNSSFNPLWLKLELKKMIVTLIASLSGARGADPFMVLPASPKIWDRRPAPAR